MERRFGFYLRKTVTAACFLWIAQNSALLFAQLNTVQPVDVLSSNQLDGLVAPIALYPDPLISQILVAATYPLEVVEAYQWMQRNPGLAGPALTQAAEAQNWDPSIQALVMFPDVMKRLSEDITWTTNLGNAFLAQEAGVMGAIQQMRVTAQQSGKLFSTPQQQVLTTLDAGQTVVEIVPANPEVIYVPVYDPVWIWGPAAYYPYPRWYFAPHSPALFFDAGIPVVTYLGRGWNGWSDWGWRPSWGSRTIVVNNTFVRRNNFNSNRLTGLTGHTVWSHDASHRRGVRYASPNVNQPLRAGIQQNLRTRPAPGPSPRPGLTPSQPRAFVAGPRPSPRPSPQVTRERPRQQIDNRAARPRNERAFTPSSPAQTVSPARPVAPAPRNAEPAARNESRNGSASREGQSRHANRGK